MRSKIILSVLICFAPTILMATFAQADCVTLDYVDIGNPGSESGHGMAGWGPIEPATSGGNYGGIADCRPVYAPEDGDVWATIDLDFGNDPTTCKTLTISHLDGLGQDSFEMYVGGILVFTYAGDESTTEQWYQTKVDVCVTGVKTVKFISTAPQWSGWDTYGQMCFDILQVEQCPAECEMLDMVNLGDVASEAGHGLAGWGPIEPATSGGSYGGIDNCRPVYAPEDGNDWASIDLDFGDSELMAKCLTIHYLEGISIDSFDLYIHPKGHVMEKRLIFSYPGDVQSDEIWQQTSILVTGTGMQTLTFVSTAPPWSGWATFGQMCFDIVRVDECPAMKAMVDIGDPASEAGFNLVGWGPIEPETSGGVYGGIDNCRPIYAPEDNNDWATIDFDFGCCIGPKCLVMEHLDGAGTDAFDVYMYPEGDPGAEQLIYSYPGDASTAEVWLTSSVLVSAVGKQTVKFVSTTPPWSGWSTFGQMCFNKIMLKNYLPVLDAVTIGDTASESGHAMAGWGPVEPATSGGNYGGAEQCRPIYAPEDNDTWATIEMDFGSCTDETKVLTMHHLDGLAVDAFDVYIYAPGTARPATPAYSYGGDSLAAEVWYKTSFVVTQTGPQVVEFVSTEPVWDMWDIYGQVCFRELRIEAGTPCSPTPYVIYPSGVDSGEVPSMGQITSIVPNPFNPKTEISFVLGVSAHANLTIFDLRGFAVATLVNDPLTAGSYTFAWNGFDTEGREMSSGVYFARLNIGGNPVQVEKLVLVK